MTRFLAHGSLVLADGGLSLNFSLLDPGQQALKRKKAVFGGWDIVTS